MRKKAAGRLNPDSVALFGPKGLKKVLGLPEVTFIAIGFMIGGGIFVFTGIVSKIAGQVLPLAYGLAVIPVFISMMPTAFFISFTVVVILYVSVAIATVGAVAMESITHSIEPVLDISKAIMTPAARSLFVVCGALVALVTTLNALFMVSTKSLLMVDILEMAMVAKLRNVLMSLK